MAYLHTFSSGFGNIVGSRIPIKYGDKIQRITIFLAHSAYKSLSHSIGHRNVTACFWPEDETFTLSNVNIMLENTYFATDISGDVGTVTYTDPNDVTKSYHYVDTSTLKLSYGNTIPLTPITFTFNTENINTNSIFFAIVSPSNLSSPFDTDGFANRGDLTVSCSAHTPSGLFYSNGHVSRSSNMYEKITDSGVHAGLDYTLSAIHQENDVIDDSSITDEEKMIYCSDIRYRTWSEPKSNFSWSSVNEATRFANAGYRIPYIDGGENFDDVPIFYNLHRYNVVNVGKESYKTKQYIVNDKSINKHFEKFESDYYLPKGRLDDVIFDRPEITEYYSTNNVTETSVPEPRWVFKRSRIMFTIPPIKKNGKIVKGRDVYIRYKVVTSIFNNANGEYTGNWKEVKYSSDEAVNDIKLVICPRDEGVLDNMSFTVIFSRSVGNNRNYSPDTTYYFHTYQKPTVNIAYPKIIRNKSTNLSNEKGFKHAKILTSNMYSNFNGENAIVNKYVCDALNVILATSANDDSGIPQFVRFYLAEFKYGRTGLISGEGENRHPDWGNKDTIQSLYRSDNSNDYAKLSNILSNDDAFKTAYMSSIYANDGQPLLLSGRFNNDALSKIGQDYKLWTYRTWDNVNESNDVEVGNAWPIMTTEHYDDINSKYYGKEKRYKPNNDGELIEIDPSNENEWKNGQSKEIYATPLVVNDHMGAYKVNETWDDNKPKSTESSLSNVILFRAGYIYLLKVRIFHGAAAGAIGAKYGYIDSVIYGKPNTGNYDYGNSDYYVGAYPYFLNDEADLALDDVSQYGELKPFTQKIKDANGNIIYKEQWLGPEDGSSGLSLSDDKINQTYAGFSQADYTIIEPVCPYVSKSNLISVHPSCSEIGANQWVTFSYRHLSKNIGGIDSYNADGSEQHTFGKRAGECQNTITRIMSIYKTCINTIIRKYKELSSDTKDFFAPITDSHNTKGDDCCKPDVTTEKISIWLEPIDKHFTIDNNGNKYLTSENKKCNTPMVYKYDITNKSIDSIINDDELYCHLDRNPGNDGNKWIEHAYPFATGVIKDNGEPEIAYSESGLYEFNLYNSKLTNDNKNTYTHSYSNTPYYNWAENNIVWRHCTKVGTPDKYSLADEPMGNSYRWQPIINAMSSNISEIQIEDVVNKDEINGPKNYPILESSVQNPNTFISSDISPIHCRNEQETCYDLQTKYAYNDDTYITEETSDYPNGYNWGNTRTRRFTINEFAGLTNATESGHDNIESPGYSVMYTTISRSQVIPYSHNGNFKFFDLKLQYNNNYGKLFLRVPVSQDCENGNVTTFNSNSNVNLSNVGNLGAKGAYDINTIDNASGNANSNNASPIVRTTHYLYFKTWINTTFYMQAEVEIDNYRCEGYYTNSSGKLVHNGDSKVDTQSGIFMFNGKDLQLIQKNGIHNISWRVTDASGTYTKKETVYDTLDNMIEYLSKSEDNRDYPTNPKNSRNDALEAARLDYYNHLLNNIDKLIIEPHIKQFDCRIKFGNSQGLTEVYAEDNYGWGRCLSADDISAKQIKYDGRIGNKVPSGGIEVPILVRYTPLLQPKLVSESCTDKNTNTSILCKTGNKNITVLRSSRYNTCSFEFANGNAASNGTNTILTNEFKLNICYPFIAENNTYNTNCSNGGIDNVYYENYHYDVDSFPNNSSELSGTNKDFLGGYGICTAYTILLVPSDPDIDKAVKDGIISDYEKKHYFTNINNHWNFYKQPANYYKIGDIFKLRSKSQISQGPIVVAYNVQPNTIIDGEDNVLDYTIDGKMCPSAWTNDTIEPIQGRNFQSIVFNINNLINGKIIYQDETQPISFTQFKDKTGIDLNGTSHVLKPGLIYDLVIVPIYSNLTVTKHDYINGAGKLNNEDYGGGITDAGKQVHLAGSNPLVIFDYLQYSLKRDIDDGPPEIEPEPEPEIKPDVHEQPDETVIWDSNPAIIFPNVDNSLYNIENGDIKECPGFWLNNSFKLIIRMPSYRTESTRFSKDWESNYIDTDNETIEIASNGMLDSNGENSNTANDFLFDDIQIHIGKIAELAEYGYPNTLHLNLNKLTSKDDLARAHIISYKHYSHSGVFSKKLADDPTDNRELLTGGALNPTHDHYKNRFIEINLSNAQIWDETKNRMVPIYTKYPEGYYIQFRYKTAYSSGTDNTQWSRWYGGSCDGGRHWWGDKGVDYYVPIRNYTNIHTDFRNYVMESYPGANMIVGKGSHMSHGDVNIDSNTNPKNALEKSYYYIGSGNQSTTLSFDNKTNTLLESGTQIVPDKQGISINETLNTEHFTKLLNKSISLGANNDTAYESEIAYMLYHDKDFKIPDNISNLHQHMWEMLYIDYVIRNLCKLYYKPKYNNVQSNDFKQFNKYLDYHLSVPHVNGIPLILNSKTCTWDNTEYHLFNTSDTIKSFKGLQNEKSISENKSSYKLDDSSDAYVNGERYKGPNNSSLSLDVDGINFIENVNKWDRNKYYRKVITKNDFDELSSHLIDLTTYIRHSSLCGSNDKNINNPVNGIKNVVCCSPDELQFNRSRKEIIGSKIDNLAGLGSHNNINYTMVGSNYIKNIWANILKVCTPGPIVESTDIRTDININ